MSPTDRRCSGCRKLKPVADLTEFTNTGGRRTVRCTPCAQKLRAEQYARLVKRVAGPTPAAAEGDFKSVYARLRARRDAIKGRRKSSGKITE